MSFNSILRCIVHRNYVNSLFFETRRFAGHNKWANIKHTKAENDFQRSLLFNQFKRKMKVAITEGGSPKPSQNSKLASVIEQAKKANMPIAAINTYLDKVTNKGDTKLQPIEVIGPRGCVIWIIFDTNNIKLNKMLLQNLAKKFKVKIADILSRNSFDHIGIVLTEMKNDLNKATDDAIEIGAQEVEEFENNEQKYLRFICNPIEISQITRKLENLEYSILSAEEEYVPLKFVQLEDAEKNLVSTFIERVKHGIEEVAMIYDNIE